jgi:hypothetical protein
MSERMDRACSFPGATACPMPGAFQDANGRAVCAIHAAHAGKVPWWRDEGGDALVAAVDHDTGTIVLTMDVAR